MANPGDNDPCIIPKTEDDINTTWIEDILHLTPVPNSLSVEGNVQDGFGFLSNLVRVCFQTEDGKPHNILVKLLPTSAEFKQVTLTERFDEKEIQFYEIVRPKLLEACPEIRQNMCDFFCARKGIFGSNEYASMIVMEDLKPAGYKMLNSKSDHWEENLRKVVECIAELHFAGQTLEKTTHTKIPQLFPFLVTTSWDGLLELGKSYLPLFESFLAENDVATEVRQAYKILHASLDKQIGAVLNACSEHPCLVHGDLWPPNIMIVEGTDLPVKLIDWQLIGYKDPTIELVISIMTCLPADKITRENLNKYCQMYYGKVKTLGMDLGRSETEFQQFFDTWGISYAYIWFLLSIEALWSDQERLKKSFNFLQQEYKVVDFLRSKLNIEN